MTKRRRDSVVANPCCFCIKGFDDFMNISLTECERISLHTAVQKLDAERMLLHTLGLANELIKTLLANDTVAVGIGIHAMVWARRRAVQLHAETHRFAILAGPQHQVQVACAEAEHDFSSRTREY